MERLEYLHSYSKTKFGPKRVQTLKHSQLWNSDVILRYEAIYTKFFSKILIQK